MLQTNLTSSLEKCFQDESAGDKPRLSHASMLRNERFSFQVLYGEEPYSAKGVKQLRVEVCSPLADCITLRTVGQVANEMPVYANMTDDGYQRTRPGLYPDPLMPLNADNSMQLPGEGLFSLWVDVNPQGRYPAGSYPVTVRFFDDAGAPAGEETLKLEIVDALLPEQETVVSQWFHADCLADYYGVPVFSPRHWELIAAFMKTAAENGQNVIYLPVFTPPLDTAVGGERTTVQLVDIACDGGSYSFDYSKMDRWCDLALSLGFRWFEVCHLFTQWGAKHAPKIFVTVDGVPRKKFGWETDALSAEYVGFLRAFLTSFIGHMKERGMDRMCRYHISDEPGREHIATYRAAKESVADLLRDYVITDALSDFEFWKEGVLETPTPANDRIQPFLDAKVKNLSTYYCCVQWNKVSNRFLSMPGARTRILGVQMYRNDVNGFLQWGYNFYNNRYSTRHIDPWQTNTGDYFVPAGDAFIVYPGRDGKPVETIRLLQFADAMQDIRALKLCESLCGREFVDALCDRCGPVRFDSYPAGSEYILSLREQVNAAIREKKS